MISIKALSLKSKRARAGIIFSLPFIIGFFFFYLTPLLRSLYYSFCRITVNVQGINLSNIGFKNYFTALFVSTSFRDTLIGSLTNLMYVSFPIIIYSFFIAMVLNQQFKGRTVARVIFFMPVILNCGVLYFLLNDIFTSAVNQAMSGIGFENSNTAINLTGNIMNSLPIYSRQLNEIVSAIVSRIYMIITSSGIQILIYLAGLQTISPSLYESSSIEGATAWENFWKITFPMLSPTILVNTVYTIIDSLCGTQNGVINTIVQTMKVNGDFGLSASMSWIYLAITLVILVVVFKVIDKFVFYEND